VAKKGKAGDRSPAVSDFFVLFSVLHMVEDPVPYDEETGDDHVGERSCAEECSHDDDLVVNHDDHLRECRNRVCPGLDPCPDRVVLIGRDRDLLPGEGDEV